jgi:hypothetical protein
VFFLLTAFWGGLFRSHLEKQLGELEPSRAKRFKRIAAGHFIAILFADALVLSIINGLIMVLQLSLPIEGVVMVANRN